LAELGREQGEHPAGRRRFARGEHQQVLTGPEADQRGAQRARAGRRLRAQQPQRSASRSRSPLLRPQISTPDSSTREAARGRRSTSRQIPASRP
jgi:hypothetical protein